MSIDQHINSYLLFFSGDCPIKMDISRIVLSVQQFHVRHRTNVSFTGNTFYSYWCGILWFMWSYFWISYGAILCHLFYMPRQKMRYKRTRIRFKHMRRKMKKTADKWETPLFTRMIYLLQMLWMHLHSVNGINAWHWLLTSECHCDWHYVSSYEKYP